MSRLQLKFLKNTHVVSEIVGEALLTAIAVLAFSVMVVSVFSYVNPPVQVHVSIQGWRMWIPTLYTCVMLVVRIRYHKDTGPAGYQRHQKIAIP